MATKRKILSQIRSARSAPFAAPLAYTGLGFLLVGNRVVDPASKEWAQWVLLFALGGFLGNFVFSLSDHAEQFLQFARMGARRRQRCRRRFSLLLRVERPFINLCMVVLLAEAAVGIRGFAMHALGNLRGPSIQAFNNFICGAPPLAPLLFPNLVILGIIALWGLRTVTTS